jgi:Small subunit of serine palmitoyltransferase-like
MATATTTTLTDLEPFPAFIDPTPPQTSLLLPFLTTLNSPLNRPRLSLSLPTELTHSLRLRYYQYSVTFGLYMLTPAEEATVNALVLVMIALLGYGLHVGLEPFIVHAFCRMIYYVTGSFGRVEELCT